MGEYMKSHSTCKKHVICEKITMGGVERVSEYACPLLLTHWATSIGYSFVLHVVGRVKPRSAHENCFDEAEMTASTCTCRLESVAKTTN